MLGSFGSPQKKVQQYDAHAQDYASLFDALPNCTNNHPLHNWKSDSSLPQPNDISSWFPNDDSIVVYPPPPNSREFSAQPLTYRRLQESLQDFAPYQRLSTPSQSSDKVYVVALWLPPQLMAEMAVVLVTLLNQGGITVAPVDSNMAGPKLLASFQHLQCTGLVTTHQLWQGLQRQHSNSTGFFQDVRFLENDTKLNITGLCRWKIAKQEPLKQANFQTSLPEPPALLLRTSGTTSTPKIVPISSTALLYNASCLAASLELSRSDVGCNVMPLFHIGGISCGLLSVLVSGSSVVMVPGPFDSNVFVDALVCTELGYIQPTYYYGVPSMHKANLFTARARLKRTGETVLNTRLRFIRSGAAHLSHELAVELAQIFDTAVIPTYSMTESMPIASAHDTPITYPHKDSNKTLKDTVGSPIGPSVAILDPNGAPVEFGRSGEVCLRGPGVITSYIGADKTETHTKHGWLRTGDIGSMTKRGQLILSGRLKEMIKRGGDQIWPSEVDSVIERLPEVRTAISFGVPNELWGEEVQVAVVLDEPAKESAIINRIQDTVEGNLGRAARPTQVHFVDSSEKLPRGSTGKYKRTVMAAHFHASAVDNGALRVLQGMAVDSCSVPARQTRSPSSALNGLRFLIVCFVVQHHVGYFPNNAWTKIQEFTLNMSIFFALAGFQLAAATKSEVLSHAGTFIGTKIGSMQAFFIVAHGIAVASSLLFQCGDNGYLQSFNGRTCADTVGDYIPAAFLNMVTGMFNTADWRSNPTSWFQAVFYFFLIVFPLLDSHFRKCTDFHKKIIFLLNLFIASTAFTWLDSFPRWNFSLISWLPLLITSMIAGYFFAGHVPHGQGAIPEARDLGTTNRRYGALADAITCILFIMEVIAATSPGCLRSTLELFERLRPGEEPRSEFSIDDVDYVYYCGLTRDEFLVAHAVPSRYNDGRLESDFGKTFGFGRLATPLVLLWIFALAHGHGWTARLLISKPLQILGPFAYPVYLLHVPVARFYWVATRGHVAQFWWELAPNYPFPVAFWEMFCIIGLSLSLSWLLDLYVVGHIHPYTISAYVKVYEKLARCCPSTSHVIKDSTESANTSLGKIQEMVQNLTGDKQVTCETNLWNLGIDSLGASAMLAMLRLSIPSAKKLTVQQLVAAEKVGDLVDLLEENDKMEKGCDSNLDSEFEKLLPQVVSVVDACC